MRRWWWLLLVTSSAAMGGPFELVPAGHSGYEQLAVVRAAGLLDRGGLDRPGVELTRFEFAQLWTVANEALLERLARQSGSVARPQPQVQVVRVADAMQRLLQAFGPELEQIDVDLAASAELLRTLPDRLPDVRATAPAITPSPLRSSPSAAPQPLPGRLPGASRAVTNDPFTVGANLLPGTAATSVGGRLPAGQFGPASAGLSLNEVTLFEYDDEGPTEFLKGHVLAADLRLKLGDNSVLLEYARSASERFGALFDDGAGDAFKATYERDLSRHLSVDLGFHRLSSKFTPFSDVFGGRPASDMVGLRAGLALDTGAFGIRSHATVYRPEGQPVGYANRFDTELRYQVDDHFQLDFGYMTATRRRLHNLEDALLQQYTAGIQYGAKDSFFAEMNVQLGSDQSGGETTYDHVIGASLGLGF